MRTLDLINNIFIIREDIEYPKGLTNKEYAVLYPTDGYYLSKKQHLAIKATLDELGLIGDVYGTDIEFIKEDSEIRCEEVRKITNFEYSTYVNDLLLFENCIYDSKFRWCISIYQDYWAIIYGTMELIDKLSLNYDLRKDLKKFNIEMIDELSDIKVKQTYTNFLNNSYILKNVESRDIL